MARRAVTRLRGHVPLLLIAAMAGCTLAVWPGLAAIEAFEAPLRLPWWAVAGLVLLTETCAVHLHFRRQAHTITLTEVALVLGLLFAAPADLVAGCVAGNATFALAARQPALKAAFNVARSALEAAVAVLVFRALLGAGTPVGDEAWLPLVLACAATTALGAGLVVAVVTCVEGRVEPARSLRSLVLALLSGATTVSLALAGSTVVWRDPTALALFVVPLGVLFVAYRAYAAERVRRETLEFLYDTSSLLHATAEPEHALPALAEHLRHVFGAERVQLVVRPLASGIEGTSVVAHATRPAERERVRVEDLPLWGLARELADVETVDDPGAAAALGVADALVAPLRAEGKLLGAVLVGDLVADADRSDRDEVALLRTVAASVCGALENERLERALTELLQVKSELRHQALHDGLTDLPNRALLFDRVAHALERHGRDGAPVTVLYFDLDGFKAVNDSLGHAAGDAVLVEVARRVEGCLRAGDTPARLGGDEFAVLLEGEPSRATVLALADRLVERIGEPMTIEGEGVGVTASIGVATGRPGDVDADALLRHADTAMYAAKTGGKARVVHHDELIAGVSPRSLGLAGELRGAAARGELLAEHQLVVSAQTGAPAGVEALVRWRHPRAGLIPPSRFIPLAEETGSIGSLGAWALERACRDARDWAWEPDVCVNLLPVQLRDPRLPDTIAAVLARTGFDPARLTLELTEQVVGDEEGAVEQLHALAGLGLRVALDDFGTGHSSLAHLAQLPIHTLKIARELVAPLSADPAATAIVEAIIALADRLRLQTIAEGVETSAQLEALRALGCDRVQGFLLARPMPAAAVAECGAGPGLLPLARAA